MSKWEEIKATISPRHDKYLPSTKYLVLHKHYILFRSNIEKSLKITKKGIIVFFLRWFSNILGIVEYKEEYVLFIAQSHCCDDRAKIRFSSIWYNTIEENYIKYKKVDA